MKPSRHGMLCKREAVPQGQIRQKPTNDFAPVHLLPRTEEPKRRPYV